MNRVTKARARKTDVETSHEAAATVAVRSGAQRVLDEVVRYYGNKQAFTLDQLRVTILYRSTTPQHITASSVRSRACELRRAGYLEYATYGNGEQQFLTPESGRRSRLLRLTKKGAAATGNGVVIHPRKRDTREEPTIDEFAAEIREVATELGAGIFTGVCIERARKNLAAAKTKTKGHRNE